MDQNLSSSKAGRKTIEKNRRNQMKALFSKLNSLVPHQSSTETISLPDQLEGATNYIKMLQANLEETKQKKNSLMGILRNSRTETSSSNIGELSLPNIDVYVMGSVLIVVLVTGLDCKFMLTRIIRVLHEEGAHAVSVSSTIHRLVSHTIQLQIEIGESAQDDEAARICEIIRKFVYDFT